MTINDKSEIYCEQAFNIRDGYKIKVNDGRHFWISDSKTSEYAICRFCGYRLRLKINNKDLEKLEQ